METSVRSKWEPVFLCVLFLLALGTHAWLTTRNWKSEFMSGHEFRQAQTAIVSYYIDRQDNFSPLYETPIVGKPWVSVLLEVPLYEWTVVAVRRATGLPLLLAARSVTLACFYLALPALYLLLARFRLGAGRRLLFLAIVLTSPVYIFYSRAFLMESMEIMFCAWFLLGFVRTMDGRRPAWLLLTVVAGTGAALLKNVTFAVWLLPAAAYGAWLLGHDLRARDWTRAGRTVLWGAATVAVPLAALRWWIAVTDPLKAAHHSAFIFTAKNLSQGYWGLGSSGMFSAEVLGALAGCWSRSILPAGLVLAVLLLGLAGCRGRRMKIAGAAAVFFAAQLMFPYAYAYQDYYFYANTLFLLGAFGFILDGVLDSRLPKWGSAALIVLLLSAQLHTYWQGYRSDQLAYNPGLQPFDRAVRDLTPAGSVIIVAGADWGAMIPYYSERKALMVRNGLERDFAYLKRACDDLAGEDVSAVILYDRAKAWKPFIDYLATRFDIDSSAPTLSHPAADVYLRRLYAPAAQARIRVSRHYYDVTVPPAPPAAKPATFAIPPEVARTAFANIRPGPYRGYFLFGLDHPSDTEADLLSAHPDCDLWLRAPAGAKHIAWEFGLLPAAYEKAGDKTNGVEFLVTGEMPDGSSRPVYRRVLDPVRQPADRGRQREVIPYAPREGESLHFATRPNGSYAFDWAYTAKIEVR